VGFCLDPAFRESELDSAGSDGKRTVVCVQKRADDGGAPERSCVEIGASGVYALASGDAPTVTRVASEAFGTMSADGRVRFEIVGGGRKPHGAIGILRDAKSGKVLKRAPVPYDEYVEALGWIGSEVVLREHVDEGPGCILRLVDPQKTPFGLAADEDGGAPTIDCFDGNLVLRPSAGTFAVVDAGGESVTFVDEATMATQVVKTGHSGGPERGRRLEEWLEGEGVLAIAYGAPESGVVARVDLKSRRLLGVTEPKACAAVGETTRLSPSGRATSVP
jgi:hypothetical protein